MIPPTSISRFVPKWNNGTWKIFDKQTHSDVRLEPREREAIDRAEWMNDPQADKRGQPNHH